MPPLRCAACAAPLRPDAAGHGHYRMKNASVGAVAACSRPCGAIGLMLATGAPPTKRADDATQCAMPIGMQMIDKFALNSPFETQTNRTCPAYQPVGARVDVDDLQLATVGNGVFLAPSTIVSASTGGSIGLGLFAGRDFHPNQPITQYYGHIFKDSARPEDRLEHAIEAVGDWVIDATRTEDNVLITDPAAQLSRLKAGGAGYANDLDFPRVTGMDIKSVRAPEGAITNAVFRRIMDQNVKARVDRGEPIGKDEFAIFLEATTHIPSGSEIFVSYNLAAYITPKSKAESLPSSSNQRDGSRRKQSAPKRR